MAHDPANIPAPIVVDKSLITAQMNAALTKAQVGLQQLHDQEASLVYNEDNLQQISSFLEKCRNAKKVIEVTHATIKEPALRACQAADASKRQLLDNLGESMNKAQLKYNQICKQIEQRKQEAARDAQRKADIKKLISDSMLDFANRIANATTLSQLTAVESLINLQKTFKHRYQEFLDEAVSKFETLRESIKEQKDKIKRYEKLKAEMETADEEAQMEIAEEMEIIEASIDESKVSVQEDAINVATESSVEDAVEVIPAVKPRRTTLKYEAVDLKETLKKMPSWVKLEINEEVVKQYLEAKKAEGAFDDKDEFTIFGIRFYKQKLF